MPLVIKDRVQETTTTTGTGTVTLAGAVSGFQSFSVIGNGNTTYYAIVGTTEWELGIGTYTSSGTTLSRDTVLSSSNSGSLVNFSAGAKNVFCTYPSERSVFAVGSGVNSNTGSIYVNKTTVTKDTVLVAGENGISVGTVTINSGVTVTVGSGQRWLVV
jgi:hypothetical protein